MLLYYVYNIRHISRVKECLTQIYTTVDYFKTLVIHWPCVVAAAFLFFKYEYFRFMYIYFKTPRYGDMKSLESIKTSAPLLNKSQLFLRFMLDFSYFFYSKYTLERFNRRQHIQVKDVISINCSAMCSIRRLFTMIYVDIITVWNIFIFIFIYILPKLF